MANQGFTATIASGVASGSVDLGSYGSRGVFVNNEATAQIDLHGSTDGTNYYPIQVGTTVTAAVGYTTHTIGSALSGKWVSADIKFQYVKVVATGTVANGGAVYFAASY